MNLENLNLVELNAQEIEVIDGGSVWFGWLSNWACPGVDFMGDGSQYNSQYYMC